MTTQETALAGSTEPKRTLERTETSEADQAETEAMFAREGLPVPEEAKTSGPGSAINMISRGMMPMLPREEDIARARMKEEYPMYTKEFDRKFKGYPKDQAAALVDKLNNRYSVMSGFAKEAETGDTNVNVLKSVSRTF